MVPYYCAHKSQHLCPILSSWIYSTPSLSKIHCNVTLRSTFTTPKRYLVFRFLDQHVYMLSHRPSLLQCLNTKRIKSIESSRHQIACFKATEGLPPPADLRQPYCGASFATLLDPSCLHSPGRRCSCSNGVRFCCDLEACNLVTATIG
jgi:hypothetical protein